MKGTKLLGNMNRGLILALSASFLSLSLIFCYPTPVNAYDPPVQGTVNATDIIIWHGDNATIVLDGTITIEGEGEIVDSFLLLFLVVIIVGLAFWQQNLFLFILACPVSIVYGLLTADSATINTPLWVASIAIVIIGLYCLYKAVILGLEDFRRSKR